MALLAVSVLGIKFTATEWVGIGLVALVIGTGVWVVLTHWRR